MPTGRRHAVLRHVYAPAAVERRDELPLRGNPHVATQRGSVLPQGDSGGQEYRPLLLSERMFCTELLIAM
jgi:hypothetical protein